MNCVREEPQKQRRNQQKTLIVHDIGAEEDRLRRKLQLAIDDKGLDCLECFEHVARDYSGEIDEREFQDGLRRLGIDLTRDEARSMMDRFPSRRRGRVSYRAFVKALRLRRTEDNIAEVEQLLCESLTHADLRGTRVVLRQPGCSCTAPDDGATAPLPVGCRAGTGQLETPWPSCSWPESVRLCARPASRVRVRGVARGRRPRWHGERAGGSRRRIHPHIDERAPPEPGCQ